MLTLEMNYAEIVRELQRIEELSIKNQMSQEWEDLLSDLLVQSDEVIDMVRDIRIRLEQSTR